MEELENIFNVFDFYCYVCNIKWKIFGEKKYGDLIKECPNCKRKIKLKCSIKQLKSIKLQNSFKINIYKNINSVW